METTLTIIQTHLHTGLVTGLVNVAGEDSTTGSANAEGGSNMASVTGWQSIKTLIINNLLN